jgi:hypothetical protein
MSVDTTTKLCEIFMPAVALTAIVHISVPGILDIRASAEPPIGDKLTVTVSTSASPVTVTLS